MISAEEQMELRNKAKQELERLERITNDGQIVELLDEFKNKFNICETTYKVVLREHQKNKTGKVPSHLKLIMTQVPFAMAFAGYSVDRDLLNRLFGSKCARGTTVKKLRDAITHGIDSKAVDEIIRRQNDLFADMDAFLRIIRSA